MKKQYTVLVFVLVLIIFGLIVSDLNSYINRYIEENAIDIAKIDTIANTRQMNSAIETRFRLLDYLAGAPDIIDSKGERSIFSVNMPGFLRLCIYDKTGDGYCMGKFLGNFENQPFYTEAMRGHRYLHVDSYNGTGEFVFSTPVRDQNGNTVGVLTGVCSSMTMYDSFTSGIHSNRGVFIYDAQKRLILCDPMVSESVVKKFYSIFSSDVSLNDNLKNGRSGMSSAKIGGVHYDLIYNRLNINDWYIVSVSKAEQDRSRILMYTNISLIVKLILLFVLLVVYYIASKKAYKKSMALIREETSMLTKTIPGSIIMCKLDELLTIRYASETAYKKLGYNTGGNSQMSTLSLREIIHPDDLKNFNKVFEQYKNTGSRFECECRFLCKSGQPKWMRCYGRFFRNEHNIKNLYIVGLDISENKNTEQRLKISEERYSVVIKQSDSVVFEYNIKNHDYFITDNFYEKFDIAQNSGDIFAVLVKDRRIHSDDQLKFDSMLNDVYSRCLFREEELRIIDASKKYAWYSLKITSIKDSGSAPTRIIGNLSNIDVQKRVEIDLENKAHVDALTGCLNREESLPLIRRLVESNTGKSLDALMIVDIDDFWAINDKYGMEAGDEILRKVGRMLRSRLRSSDVAGRIGDDEFVVYLRGCTEISHIISTADSIVNEARTIASDSYKGVTLSIGAAIYPTHSTNYEDLYDKADKALYMSKTTGQDKYTIYEENKM